MALIKRSTLKPTETEVGHTLIKCSCCNNPIVSNLNKTASVYNICSDCAKLVENNDESKNNPKTRKRIHKSRG